MNPVHTFLERLPRRPWCANDPRHGLFINKAKTAIKFPHIQPNAPFEASWLMFDIDRQGAALAWEEAWLPPPTVTIINPTNAHAHLWYGLNTPVCLSDMARAAPIRYAAAIQAAYCTRLQADPAFAGLISKNPLHERWRTVWVPKLYDLGELAEYVTLKKERADHEPHGWGRNCTLFDQLRAWAYQWAIEYERNGSNQQHWRCAVLGQAERLNQFEPPLPSSEVRAIAKSVADWTWKNFSMRSFSALQSARGQLGGRPRTTTKDGEPWVAMGVSKATYYRRRAAEGKLQPT